MEGPISVWGYKEQQSNLILPEHDEDDEVEFYCVSYGYCQYVRWLRLYKAEEVKDVLPVATRLFPALLWLERDAAIKT